MSPTHKKSLYSWGAFLLAVQFGVVPPVFSESPTDRLLDPLKKLQNAVSGKAKNKTTTAVNKSVSETSEANGLRLEGVASGSHGGSDIAMIDGDAYRVGEEVKGERILEIHPSYIQIENRVTLVKRVIWVGGKPSAEEMDAIDFEPEFIATVPLTIQQKLAVWAVQSGMASQKATNAALLDLRRVQNAVQIMSREKPGILPGISDLIQSRYLPDDFLKDQFFYQFSTDDQGAHADPRSEFKKLPHFFLGEDDLIRIEKNVVAGASSPIWDKVSS